MRSKKIRVTIRTKEVTSGEDFVMKIKINKTDVPDTKPRGLAESTIEFDSVRYNAWEEQAKARARTNSLKGIEFSESIEYWIADESDDEDPADEGPKKDSELGLPELRAKYPDIKATSIAGFLALVEAAKES